MSMHRYMVWLIVDVAGLSLERHPVAPQQINVANSAAQREVAGIGRQQHISGLDHVRVDHVLRLLQHVGVDPLHQRHPPEWWPTRSGRDRDDTLHPHRNRQTSARGVLGFTGADVHPLKPARRQGMGDDAVQDRVDVEAISVIRQIYGRTFARRRRRPYGPSACATLRNVA